MTDTSHDRRGEGGDRGLECPKCGCRHLPVLYTRRRLERILRVRVCRCCGRRLRTIERMQTTAASSAGQIRTDLYER
jgi:hypothetical protein